MLTLSRAERGEEFEKQWFTEAPVLVMGCINAWVLVGHERARIVSGRWGFDLLQSQAMAER